MSRAFTKKPTSDRQAEAEAADDAAELTPERIWSRLLAWQARRECSRGELAAKLARLGVDEALAESLLDRLAELGLQNDDRYAEALVRSQLQRGRGQRVIRQRLQQSGLAPDHPALAEQSAELDWAAEGRALLRRRFGEVPADDQKERARRVRFLQYRGFSLGQALAALGRGDDDPEPYN